VLRAKRIRPTLKSKKGTESQGFTHRLGTGWLTPVILGTWEDEIKKIMIGLRHRRKVFETPPHLNQ
jgi:hypothetical protein